MRCSFLQVGQFSGASGCEASDSAGLHAFFMSVSETNKNLLINCRSPQLSVYNGLVFSISKEILGLAIDKKS